MLAQSLSQAIGFKTTKKSQSTAARSPSWEIRRIGVEHTEAVSVLFDKSIALLFGDVDIRRLLYHSYVTLGMFAGDNLVGCASFSFHPNIPAVAPWSWEKWLRDTYGITGTANDTVWIHLAACSRPDGRRFFPALVKQRMANSVHHKQVLMVVPPGVTRVEWMEEVGTRIWPKGMEDNGQVQSIYLLRRETLMTDYRIRLAVEEDNDDLVPLIGLHQDSFRELYGEYYISELLTTHRDSGRSIIVAEDKGVPVGVACLNSYVNYDELKEDFEVMPYNGFRCLQWTESLALDAESANKTDEESFALSNMTGTSKRQKVFDKASFASLNFSEKHLENREDSPCHTAKEPLSQLSVVSYPDVVSIPGEGYEEEDDFDIIHVSSGALLDVIPASDEEEFSLSSSSSELSGVDVGFTELCTQLYNSRTKKCNASEMSRNIVNVQTIAESVPAFHGSPDAFTVEVLCCEPDHTDCLVKLLEASFVCFPDRSYALLSMPPGCSEYAITRLMAAVPQRPHASHPHQLYALHISSIAASFTAKRCAKGDKKRIASFLDKQMRRGHLVHQIEDAVDNPESSRIAFEMLCEEQIIGVAVVTEDLDVDYFYNHYEFKPFVDPDKHSSGTVGLIESLILAPAFRGEQGKFFIREIHRLGDFSLLFYRLTSEDVGELLFSSGRPVMNLLEFMCPLFPRTLPEYDEKHLKDQMPSPDILKEKPLFSLYMSTPRTASMRRVSVTTRVVVVGGGRTTIAFLEALLFTQNTNAMVIWDNVTVICPNGLPLQRPPKRSRKLFFPSSCDIDYMYMEQRQFRSYVHVVNGVMTGIDRRNHRLIVNEDMTLPYDLLVLSCGEQFQRPVPSQRSTDHPHRKREAADNLFVINTYSDAAILLAKINPETTKFDRKLPIIVYGHYLEAYCCLTALLDHGVQERSLVLVEPFPDRSTGADIKEHLSLSIFNDGQLEDAVLDVMRAKGITVHESCLLSELRYGDNNLVTSVRFETPHRFLDIECQAIVFYERKCVSHKTFAAFIKAGLVFDGNLVIDAKCRTNDPSIYACGSVTKYSRRLYADHQAHRYFSTLEVGRRLGLQIRRHLVARLINAKGKQRKDYNNRVAHGHGELVPVYKDPLVVSCLLPGGLHYASITKPGKPVPLEIAMSRDDYSTILMTGDPERVKEKGYFRMHIDQYGVVDSIKCLSKDPVYVRNLRHLYGKPHDLLNNLMLRCEMNKIKDMFEFFKEPWSYAIYHDHFVDLTKKLKEMFTHKPFGDSEKSLKDRFVELLKKNNWTELTRPQMNEISEEFIASPLYKEVAQTLLDYLQCDQKHLPMYAQPILVRQFLQEFQHSPMFLPQ